MQVEIFQYDLTRLGLDINQAYQFLDEEEQLRADRLIIEPAKRAFILSHAMLREVLALRLDINPKKLHYVYNRYGKPALIGDPIYFNLSHSGDMALLGICKTAPVGVDIEKHKTIIDFAQISERFFSSSEAAALMRVEDSERLAVFFRLWTRKEAYLKMIGRGVSFGLDKFTVSIKEAGMDCLQATVSAEFAAQTCYLGSLTVSAGYSAALCVPNKSPLDLVYADKL